MIMVVKHDTVTKYTVILELSVVELATLKRFISDGLHLHHNEALKRAAGVYTYPTPGTELAVELFSKLGELK